MISRTCQLNLQTRTLPISEITRLPNYKKALVAHKLKSQERPSEKERGCHSPDTATTAPRFHMAH